MKRLYRKSPLRTVLRSPPFLLVYFAVIIITVVVIIPVANDRLSHLKQGKGLTRSDSRSGASLRAEQLMTADRSKPIGELGTAGGGLQLDGVSEEEAFWFEPLEDPPASWPDRLILTIAVDLAASNLPVLIKSFNKNVKDALLVIFAKKRPWEWVPQKGVVLQLYHPPQTGWTAELGYWAQRFLVYEIFLKVIGHKGHVVLSDARDVAFLGDPFTSLADNQSHFFQESTVLPSRTEEGQEEKTDSWHRLQRCFDERIAWSYGGTHVISAGFMAGPTDQMLSVLRDMRVEFSRVPRRCLEALGGDQATLNHIVKSGRVRIGVPRYRLESNERGPVLTILSKKAPYIIIGSAVLNTMGEIPFAVIHGYDRWPDLEEVVKKQIFQKR